MKGILFTEDMFHAVVGGRKTQTRRIDQTGKPRYKRGEILYLKEPYAYWEYIDEDIIKRGVSYKYRGEEIDYGDKWNNKLFMPEKRARYFIQITDVRQENLWDIQEHDARNEGVERAFIKWEGYLFKDYISGEFEYYSARDSFVTLWESIHGIDAWATNSTLWVYEFKLVEKP